MKSSETAAALSAELAKSLHTQLRGLSEKHTKKLEKAVEKSTDKLARLFVKYTEQELDSTEKKGQKTAARAAKLVPKKAVKKLRKAILNPAALLAISPVAVARPVVVRHSKRRAIAA